MDKNSKAALELYQRAEALKAQGKLDHGFGIGPQGTMPRVRLASDVDVSKADKNCERCSGSGFSGFEIAAGERIPIVCRCVSRGGGIKSDRLDKVMRVEARRKN